MLLIMSCKEAVAVVSTIYPNISLGLPKKRTKIPDLLDQTPIQNTKPEPPESEAKMFVSTER